MEKQNHYPIVNKHFKLQSKFFKIGPKDDDNKLQALLRLKMSRQ